MGLTRGEKKAVAERREKVRALWESGERETTDIAAALGVTYNVVWRDLRFLGLITPERRPRGVAPKRREKVRALIKRGLSAREIAEALGLSATMVYRDRHALGVQFSADRNRTPARKEARVRAVKVMVDGGMSKDEIALALDVSAPTLRAYFRETLIKPDEPELPDSLRDARENSSLDFCLCLDQNCEDYIAHESAILEWTWARVAQMRRASIRGEGVPISIPFDSVA